MSVKDRIKIFNSSTSSEIENKSRSTTVIVPPQSIIQQKKLTKAQTTIDNKKEKNEDTPRNNKNILKRASFLTDNTKETEPNKLQSKKADDNWTDLDKEIDLFSSTQLNDNDIDTFDENKYLNRKYSKDNINNGKKFFKLRYIQRKKKKKTKTTSKQNELTLDDEKNNRIYNSDFLLILEQSILLFNQKKYQESFDNLKISEMLSKDEKNKKNKNESIEQEEFGEFLLVVSGFDKYLIGEFLAKDKPPNQNGKILNSFINCINMNHKENSLLDCVRFLLSRINLPKDANLILVIMEAFTKTFFKVNEHIKEFLDIFVNSDNIYLLVSTMLALNTMFTRKDIKNMNTIKKEEFINMNKQINENYLSTLYDQLKSKPITMSDDYNDAIYQKLTPLVNEKTNTLNKNKLGKFFEKFCFFSDRRETNSLTGLSKAKINFDNFTKEDEELICNINKFYKISGTKKTPKIYDVVVYEKCTKLAWDKNLNMMKIKKGNTINISDINEIYNGIDITERSSQIKKYIKANPIEEKLINSFICISYNNNKDSLNLKCDNVETTLKWFKAFKSLINKNKNNDKEIEKTEDLIKEIDNNIKEIWQNYILQKWEKYGNYFLLKLHERSNFYNYLSNDLKQSTKNELLEEKKTNNIKYIANFLENAKENFNKKDIDINEFYFLCNLGFFPEIRNKIWGIMIGNPCFLTTKIYDSLKNKIKFSINFEKEEKEYNKKNDKNNNNNPSKQMIFDIIIIKQFFVNDIKNKIKEKEGKDKVKDKIKNEFDFMKSVYTLATLFFDFRKDIPYNKAFIDIIYLFLLVDDSEENAFRDICNFILNNDFNFMNLFLDEQTRKEINSNNISFFNQIFKNKLSNIEEHFKQLEIIPELYFIPWMDDLYIETLDMKILLPIFDLYLINGEYVLFQTAIAILKSLEDELRNMTINQVLNLLKRLPENYKKEKFFEIFNSFNGIKSEYTEWKRNIELSNQKKILENKKP